MISTALTVATFLLAAATYYKLKKLSASYQELLKTICSMKEVMEKLIEADKSQLEIFQTQRGLHDWYIPSIKYLLVALSKYVEEMKKQAIKDERYEEARQCNSALLEMYKLIKA